MNDQRTEEFTSGPEVTTTSTVVRPPAPSQTSASQLSYAAAALRDQSRILHEDAQHIHHATLNHNLEARTHAWARLPVQDVLGALAKRGFAWSTVARLVGVSVPAVRKWRLGESVSGENRRRLSQLAAMCDLLESDYMVNDVAGWMAVPLVERVPTTPSDLYQGGRLDLVLDWAAHRLTAEQILDEVDSEWRHFLTSDTEVFVAEDGMRSIRHRQ